MARSARLGKLESRTARLKLPVAKKPIFVKIAPRVGLGYRRNQSSGAWVVRVADGKGGNWTKAIGFADDYDEADGTSVFDFWQAQDRARAVGRLSSVGDGAQTKIATVDQALTRYQRDLETRGGDIGNVARVRSHLTETLSNRTVALLSKSELRAWRDALADDLAAASVNRTATVLKAALNLAADHDERIPSRSSWEIGLATIPDAEQSRNVVLCDSLVRQLIAAAQEQSAEFGLLAEVAAVTGARVSQLSRLEAADIQSDRCDPRLMMPSSKKGRGQKKIMRRPVPVPADLASRLAYSAKGKTKTAPLLVKPSGEAWRKSDHSRLFKRSVKTVVNRASGSNTIPIKLDGHDPVEVTIYSFRHSNIVRQLLANTPIRVVAANHDTSVAMIERNYSEYISDHSDALVRAGLFDVGQRFAA